MKIAVTAVGNGGLEEKVDTRFGRAAYFAVIDVKSSEVKFIANSAVNAASGAGVQAAQLVADQQVEALISGNIGPKAFRGLQAAGLKLYAVEEGTLEQVLHKFRAGELTELSNPTSNSHAGL